MRSPDRLLQTGLQRSLVPEGAERSLTLAALSGDGAATACAIRERVASHHLQNQAFQVVRLRDRQQNRVIFGLRAPFEDA